MRTDCTIKTEGSIHLPNVSVGHIRDIKRGDVVIFDESGEVLGRVIGFVEAKDIEGPHLLVSAVFNGVPYERWVKPSDVVRSFDAKYLAWLFTDVFLSTPVDVARRASEYLVKDLLRIAIETQRHEMEGNQ